MTYLRYLLLTSFLVLSVCAGINYFIDPASVYHSEKTQPAAYAEALIKSEHGLWWPENSFEDREVKKPLAKYAGTVECVVVGSSHIMQIGSSRASSTFGDQCSSILNLGVSGASIEDHFVLAYLALKNQHPKKMVLGIDPWTFAFGKDARWSYYADDYKNARGLILINAGELSSENTDTLQSKLRNLLSLEYTIRSVRKLRSIVMGTANQQPISAAPKLDEQQGGESPVLFQDGSLLYSAKYLALAKATPIRLGGENYKTNGILNDHAAIEAYKNLLRWIKGKGVEPILLMTPYHQNTWKATESLDVSALVATEPIVRKIGNELGLKVIGTFNPDTAGCVETEFFDLMHPSTDCLARLRQQATHDLKP